MLKHHQHNTLLLISFCSETLSIYIGQIKDKSIKIEAARGIAQNLGRFIS